MMNKNKNEQIMIKEASPLNMQVAGDPNYLPTYSVPREKSIIKAKKKTGFLTFAIGLILWYFNSDRK